MNPNAPAWQNSGQPPQHGGPPAGNNGPPPGFNAPMQTQQFFPPPQCRSGQHTTFYGTGHPTDQQQMQTGFQQPPVGQPPSNQNLGYQKPLGFFAGPGYQPGMQPVMGPGYGQQPMAPQQAQQGFAPPPPGSGQRSGFFFNQQPIQRNPQQRMQQEQSLVNYMQHPTGPPLNYYHPGHQQPIGLQPTTGTYPVMQQQAQQAMALQYTQLASSQNQQMVQAGPGYQQQPMAPQQAQQGYAPPQPGSGQNSGFDQSQQPIPNNPQQGMQLQQQNQGDYRQQPIEQQQGYQQPSHQQPSAHQSDFGTQPVMQQQGPMQINHEQLSIAQPPGYNPPGQQQPTGYQNGPSGQQQEQHIMASQQANSASHSNQNPGNTVPMQAALPETYQNKVINTALAQIQNSVNNLIQVRDNMVSLQFINPNFSLSDERMAISQNTVSSGYSSARNSGNMVPSTEQQQQANKVLNSNNDQAARNQNGALPNLTQQNPSSGSLQQGPPLSQNFVSQPPMAPGTMQYQQTNQGPPVTDISIQQQLNQASAINQAIAAASMPVQVAQQTPPAASTVRQATTQPMVAQYVALVPTGIQMNQAQRAQFAGSQIPAPPLTQYLAIPAQFFIRGVPMSAGAANQALTQQPLAKNKVPEPTDNHSDQIDKVQGQETGNDDTQQTQTAGSDIQINQNVGTLPKSNQNEAPTGNVQAQAVQVGATEKVESQAPSSSNQEIHMSQLQIPGASKANGEKNDHTQQITKIETEMEKDPTNILQKPKNPNLGEPVTVKTTTENLTNSSNAETAKANEVAMEQVNLAQEQPAQEQMESEELNVTEEIPPQNMAPQKPEKVISKKSIARENRRLRKIERKEAELQEVQNQEEKMEIEDGAGLTESVELEEKSGAGPQKEESQSDVPGSSTVANTSEQSVFKHTKEKEQQSGDGSTNDHMPPEAPVPNQDTSTITSEIVGQDSSSIALSNAVHKADPKNSDAEASTGANLEPTTYKSVINEAPATTSVPKPNKEKSKKSQKSKASKKKPNKEDEELDELVRKINSKEEWVAPERSVPVVANEVKEVIEKKTEKEENIKENKEDNSTVEVSRIMTQYEISNIPLPGETAISSESAEESPKVITSRNADSKELRKSQIENLKNPNREVFLQELRLFHHVEIPDYDYDELEICKKHERADYKMSKKIYFDSHFERLSESLTLNRKRNKMIVKLSIYEQTMKNVRDAQLAFHFDGVPLGFHDEDPSYMERDIFEFCRESKVGFLKHPDVEAKCKEFIKERVARYENHDDKYSKRLYDLYHSMSLLNTKALRENILWMLSKSNTAEEQDQMDIRLNQLVSHMSEKQQIFDLRPELPTVQYIRMYVVTPLTDEHLSHFCDFISRQFSCRYDNQPRLLPSVESVMYHLFQKFDSTKEYNSPTTRQVWRKLLNDMQASNAPLLHQECVRFLMTFRSSIIDMDVINFVHGLLLDMKMNYINLLAIYFNID